MGVHMFGKRPPRIEPWFQDAVPANQVFSRELTFTFRETERGWAVDFTRDGMSQEYVIPVTHRDSAHMMVLEGLRRLAKSDGGRVLVVIDPTDGFRTWLTRDRWGARRLIPNVPDHEVR